MSQLDLFGLGTPPEPASKKKGKEGVREKISKDENGAEAKSKQQPPQQTFFDRINEETNDRNTISALKKTNDQEPVLAEEGPLPYIENIPVVEKKTRQAIDNETDTSAQENDTPPSEEGIKPDISPVISFDEEKNEHHEPRLDDINAFDNVFERLEDGVPVDFALNDAKPVAEEENVLADEDEQKQQHSPNFEDIVEEKDAKQLPKIVVENQRGPKEDSPEGPEGRSPVDQAVKIAELQTEAISQVIYTDGKIGVKYKRKQPVLVKPVEELKQVAETLKIKKLPQKRGRKSFKEIDAEIDLIEIPEDEELFKKQYYPISVVAKWFRVNTSLLRFWENEFDILKPRKNRKGDRMFRPEDVKNLVLIYHLLRQKKFTIDGAKEFIKTNKRKADMQLQLTQTLQKFKSFLLELKANLQS